MMDGFLREAKQVGEQIRRLRRQRGLTQRQLAERAGLFDVGELERGYKVKGGDAVNPHLQTLSKIAAALDVTLGELFGHDPPDEVATHIAELLVSQNPRVKRQATRIIQVLVAQE